ncbi:MAG: hypothetical protein QM778_16320 [Myxococcales bacterium]
MCTRLATSAPRLGRFAALVMLVASGCNDGDFPSPETVEKDRVLAGRVFLSDDDPRVTPAPGETAHYQLLVGSPGVQATWTYLLAVCRFLRDENGAPYCDPTLPPLAQSGLEPSLATPPAQLPELAFTVPSAPELRDDESELLVQGIVCPGGPIDDKLLAALAAQDFAVLEAGRNPCADKSKNGVLIAAPIPIERSLEDRNHAPVIQTVTWSKAMDMDDVALGEPWTSDATTTDPSKGCAGKGFLELRSKERLGFQFGLDAAARESYLDPSPIPGAPRVMREEIPRVQGLSSAGKFEIRRDNQVRAEQVLQLEWRLPDYVPPKEGLLVRFWFLATDDRDQEHQATSWQTRALCAVP